MLKNIICKRISHFSGNFRHELFKQVVTVRFVVHFLKHVDHNAAYSSVSLQLVQRGQTPFLHEQSFLWVVVLIVPEATFYERLHRRAYVVSLVVQPIYVFHLDKNQS